jgi:HlyD family secretion protein
MSSKAGGSSPFRQSALDRLSSPEQLDQLVRVADAKGWVAAIGLLLFVSFAAAWGVLGSIPTQVQAPGILVIKGGRLMNVPSPASGMIADLRVRAGDQIVRGQVIATLRQVELNTQVANAKVILAERKEAMAKRIATTELDAPRRRADAEARKQLQRQIIVSETEHVRRLQAQLAVRMDLRKQNLAVEDRVEQTRNELAGVSERLIDARAKLAEIDTSMMEAEFAQKREIDQMALLVGEAQRNVNDLSQRLSLNTDVVAPADGRVTELTAGEGSTVQQETTILNIETPGTGLEATVYVPIETGKKVKLGMPVHLEPSTVRREEYGMMVGAVGEISPYPSTPQGMLAVLQNQRLVESLLGGGSPYQAIVKLPQRPSPSGYTWTSGEGPRIDLTSGTPVKAYITVQSDPPIILLLPFLRKLFGGNP